MILLSKNKYNFFYFLKQKNILLLILYNFIKILIYIIYIKFVHIINIVYNYIYRNL